VRVIMKQRLRRENSQRGNPPFFLLPAPLTCSANATAVGGEEESAKTGCEGRRPMMQLWGGVGWSKRNGGGGRGEALQAVAVVLNVSAKR
jgi:hypothetical protein